MQKLFLGLIILFVFLILAALALPFLVNLNQYQDEFRPVVEKVLNRKVSVKNVRLMIVPRFGVRVEHVTIMDDPSFSSSPFASLRSLDIGVKLRPLLNRRVEVEEVVLHDPTITVIRNPEGVFNFSTLGRQTTTSASSGEGSPLHVLGLFAVDEVSLEHGKVTYSDHSGNQPTEYGFADVEMNMKSIRLGQTAGLHLSTRVQPFDLPVTLDGTFGPLKETLEFEELDFAVRMGESVSNVKGGLAGGSLKMEVTSQILSSGDLPLPFTLAKPFKVHHLELSFQFDYPTKAGVSIQDTIKQAKLDFDLEMGSSTVIVAGNGTSGDFHLAATAEHVETADLPMPLPLTKSVVVRDLKLETDAKYPSPDGRPLQQAVAVNLLTFEVVMGGSVLAVQGSGPAGDLKLVATSKNLSSADLPFGDPPNKPVMISDLQLAAEVHQPRVQVSSLTFNVLGGRVQAAGEATMGVAPMPFEGKLTLQNIQLGPALEAVSNSPIVVNGTAEAHLAVKGNGVSTENLAQGLTGTGHLSAKEGTLEGVNLLKEAMMVAKDLGLSFDATNTTAFDTLDATFHLERGLVHVDRLQLRNRLMETTAIGTIGFDQSLNLRTKVTLQSQRITVPIAMGGFLQAPTYALDTGAIGLGLKKLHAGAEADRPLEKTSRDLLNRGQQNLKDLVGP